MPSQFTTGSLTPDVLGEVPLFMNLTPQELSRVRGYLHAKVFSSGTNLFNVEQPGEVAYIILEGTIKVHVEQSDGGDVILAVLGPGEIVGEMSLVDRIGRSASVVTMEDCMLAWLDRATFWDCLQTIPTMTYNLVSILSRRLRLANAQIESLATQDVFGRVARQILAFAAEYGRKLPDGSLLVPIRLTQTDLAGLIGATRVRVNQVLVSFKEQQYITVDSEHHITVVNSEALAQRCL
jgi:CRP/FNR family cyclic AMP-dependent transcriptional regulator